VTQNVSQNESEPGADPLTVPTLPNLPPPALAHE